MNGLLEWVAADRWLAVTALAVAALSGGAWLIAQPWGRSPAVRHLILLAGLLGCLAAPVVVGVREATGMRFLTIPLGGAVGEPPVLSPPRSPSAHRPVDANRLPPDRAANPDPPG